MREGDGERGGRERGRYVSLQLKVLRDYIWKRKDSGMEERRRERENYNGEREISAPRKGK